MTKNNAIEGQFGYNEVSIYICDNDILFGYCVFSINMIKDQLKTMSKSEFSASLDAIKIAKHIWCHNIYDTNGINEEHLLLNLAYQMLLVSESFLYISHYYFTNGQHSFLNISIFVSNYQGSKNLGGASHL